MGLGPVRAIPLECPRVRVDGIDLIEVQRAEREQKSLDAAKSMTFGACAAVYIDAHKAGWRNAKHIDQWSNTLSTYASPVFGSLPMQAVDVGLAMKALEPIWQTKSETASRLRGRIEAALATSSSQRATRFAK